MKGSNEDEKAVYRKLESVYFVLSKIKEWSEGPDSHSYHVLLQEQKEKRPPREIKLSPEN